MSRRRRQTKGFCVCVSRRSDGKWTWQGGWARHELPWGRWMRIGLGKLEVMYDEGTCHDHHNSGLEGVIGTLYQLLNCVLGMDPWNDQDGSETEYGASLL